MAHFSGFYYGTRADTCPKRWRGWNHYGIRFSKTKKILDETDHNKLYKQARWREVNQKRFKRYCTVCGSECIGWYGKKQKRNNGQKPCNKNKPWRKRH